MPHKISTMNKLIFATLFLISTHCVLFAQQYGWVLIDPVSISGNPFFTDVYFISDNTGWITTSSSNNIYRTDDGAATFTSQATSLGYTEAIHMLDANNGYSGGQGGWVYKTNTGGLNWNILNSMGILLLDISFPPGTDPNNPVGYASGDNGQVWKIDSTLTNLNTGLAGPINGISAPSVNNVWFCVGNSIFYYNGASFTGQSGPSGTFNDIHFINDQEGWVVGNAGIIGRTTNGGATWVTLTNPDPQSRSLYGVFFLNSNEGWAVGGNGAILHTSNGGTTWTVQTVPGLSPSAFLTGVHFTSPTNGYVVGNNKTLLKYTLISGIESPAWEQVHLYPNPTRGKFRVQGSAPIRNKVVSVEVVDFYGRTLFSGMMHPVMPDQEFDISHLKPGVYLVKMQMNEMVFIRKIVKQ
jgi:photosystem II stability/assembly factor-like uncharacterized protein